jgi:hypothetical protein
MSNEVGGGCLGLGICDSVIVICSVVLEYGLEVISTIILLFRLIMTAI